MNLLAIPLLAYSFGMGSLLLFRRQQTMSFLLGKKRRLENKRLKLKKEIEDLNLEKEVVALEQEKANLEREVSYMRDGDRRAVHPRGDTASRESEEMGEAARLPQPRRDYRPAPVRSIRPTPRPQAPPQANQPSSNAQESEPIDDAPRQENQEAQGRNPDAPRRRAERSSTKVTVTEVE